MEIGSKEQINFLKGYPILGVLIISLGFNAYLLIHGNIIYEKWIAEQAARIKSQSEVISDYRQNANISNQLNKASQKLNE